MTAERNEAGEGLMVDSIRKSKVMDVRGFELLRFDARQIGIGRSTLHYLRKKAEGTDSFNVRRHTLVKINLVQ
jgi:hypothetical protein